MFSESLGIPGGRLNVMEVQFIILFGGHRRNKFTYIGNRQRFYHTLYTLKDLVDRHNVKSSSSARDVFIRRDYNIIISRYKRVMCSSCNTYMLIVHRFDRFPE